MRNGLHLRKKGVQNQKKKKNLYFIYKVKKKLTFLLVVNIIHYILQRVRAYDDDESHQKWGREPASEIAKYSRAYIGVKYTFDRSQ